MGYDILVGGDFNETIEKGGIMVRTMEELGMPNAMGAKSWK